MSTEVLEELKKIHRQLVEIQKTLTKGESTKTEYSIVTVFIGFVPFFLFLISYFHGNPDHLIEYFMTVALFLFFFGASLVWAVVQIAKTKTPFAYTITIAFPLFIIALPFIFSVCVFLDVLPISQTFEYLAIVVITIYAVVFLAIFIINLLYNKLIAKS